MTSDTSGDARTVAIDQLKTLGLTTYAARTFVALHEVDGGTAKDVSAVAEVPRTRVYDAVSELSNAGLATIEETEPKRFHAVSPETAANVLRQEYGGTIARMAESIGALVPTGKASERRGVWSASGRDAVTERVVHFVDQANEEVGFVTAPDLVDDAVLNALAAAHDRGVDVMVATPTEATDEVFDSLPADVSVVSAWDGSFRPVVRLLVVDRTTTLASVLPRETEGATETGVWAIGDQNELVVVVRSLVLSALGAT